MKKTKSFPPNRPISIAYISVPRLEGKRAKIKPNKLIEKSKTAYWLGRGCLIRAGKGKKELHYLTTLGYLTKFSIIVKDFESLLLSLDATRRNIQLSE